MGDQSQGRAENEHSLPVAPALSRGGAGPASRDAHDLGPALEPGLIHACEGRLTDVHWFRTDWQIGGAATAYARYAVEPDEAPRDVVIKLPVGPREYRFLTRLCETDAPTPRVAQHGAELGGYDFAWVVMERLPGNPPAGRLSKEVFEQLAEAAAKFYLHCGRCWPLELPPAPPDWDTLLTRARDALRDNPDIPHCQEWQKAVKHAHRSLPSLIATWSSRAINTWRHGDLHLGNCMFRPENSPWRAAAGCVLFDLAEAQSGHWVEDAVYLERLYWGRPEALDGVKPVSLLARARRNVGLDTSDDYAGLANVRRVLMASTSPAFLKHEGRSAHLNAALEVLERLLPQVTK